ncbi:MAG: bifunctional 4-hydroxy-2-oxoglutarate aldolase/2-dehydro-3-deoxy-phosphogluconate aldolase [Acidimicrobiia bacterium]|nr:bifunctional 4-hydroxy-2-oxoglutarate aldolase/2-dehydro-3-deoxy-phosphogluconate aldolase [Acidimicrobiia bacterium]
MDPLDQIAATGIVPVVEIDVTRSALPLVDALVSGGLTTAEITLRTEVAIAVISEIARYRPDFLVGAGTVRTMAQAEQTADAGARFIVSPGLNHSVVDYCQKAGIRTLPGVATSTEIEVAVGLGLSVLKLFPIKQLGGVEYLSALAGPFGDVRFVPSGGIGPDALGDYFSRANVLAIGGSWIAPRSAIDHGDFAGIETRANQAVAKVRAVRAKVVEGSEL